MRQALVDNYQMISNGVQCASQDYWYYSFGRSTLNSKACNIVCADIYNRNLRAPTLRRTRLSPTTDRRATLISSTCDAVGAGDYSNTVATTRYQVESQLPLFQMKSMIDLLDTFLHTRLDLAQHFGRIELQAEQNLCIEVAGADPTPGTPLLLEPCNGSAAQQWTYDRVTGQISNPNLGTCLDVDWASPLSRTTVWSWPCTAPQGMPPRIDNPAQQWTYDPETRLLLNALGTTLVSTGTGANSGLMTWRQSHVFGGSSARDPYLAVLLHADHTSQGTSMATIAPTSC